MIRVAAAAFFLFVSDGGAEQARPAQGRGRLVVQQQIIIRVGPPPRRPRPGLPAMPLSWSETRGPRCVPARQMAGATQLRQESVDLVLHDGTRLRAQLERRCPALDFYQGVYLSPTRDGMVCADRDAIRSRAGAECAIERFRLLRPRLP